MLRIGIVGVGFMGYTHFEAARTLKGARVVALATRDKKKLAGDWTGIQGNFGPPGGHVDLSDIRKYPDYRDLLRDPDIDLVDICLPTGLHTPVTLEAVAAGKPTLVEKPIAIDLKSADRMVAAAKKAGVPLFVGQVLPFFPEFRFALECVRRGRHGRLLAAHLRRVIAPPKWSSHIEDFRKLGGWGIDLHIHDNHFISLLCGMPAKVFSRGILSDGLVNHVHTQYIFGVGPPIVSCVSGGIAASGRQFGHGFELYFEKASVVYSAGTVGGQWQVERPLTLITNRGKVSVPKLAGGEAWCAAFTAELQAVVNALRQGREEPTLSGATARDALRLCYAEAKSVATGKPVAVG
jgi:predicted dehydrogenase